MENFERLLQEQLRDPAFREEWEAMHPQREVMRALLKARSERGITQQQLAERTGIQIENIRMMEQGSMNPSVKLLHIIAQGMGKKLSIAFIDQDPPDGRMLP